MLLQFFASCYTIPTYRSAALRVQRRLHLNPKRNARRKRKPILRYIPISKVPPSLRTSLPIYLPTYIGTSTYRHNHHFQAPPYLWMARRKFYDSAIHLHLHLHLRGLHTTPHRTHSLTHSHPSIQIFKARFRISFLVNQIIYIPSNLLLPLLFTRYGQGQGQWGGWVTAILF